MKAISSLFFAAALVATGISVTMDSYAARGGGGGGGGGARGGGSGSWSGGHGGGGYRGGGHYHGGGRYYGGRGYYGGYWGAGWGYYAGVPLLWGSSYYWGYPYASSYYYPSTVVVDQAVERYPRSYPQGVMEPAPTTQVPMPAEGAPTQGPAYMNYCESAKAYYPKVSACPEGWRFLPTR